MYHEPPNTLDGPLARTTISPLTRLCQSAGVEPRDRFYMDDICRLMGCTPRTISRKCERGLLRLYRTGRMSWAWAEDVAQLIVMSGT